MAEDSGDGLTVREVADLSGLHIQTVRRYIREGELAAEKVQGTHGPEWRIRPEDAESLAREQQPESAEAEQDLRRTDSMLSTILTRLTELQAGQQALQPSQEELQQRRRWKECIEQALRELPEVTDLEQRTDSLPSVTITPVPTSPAPPAADTSSRPPA